jgi:hypothetical protein
MSENVIFTCQGCGEKVQFVWISDLTAVCIECGHQEHV